MLSETEPALNAFPRSAPPRTLIVIATYNERENLPQLVRRLGESAPQADILVVDDHSPDGTGEWCDQEAAGNARLACLHRTGKLGLGSAIIAGLAYAIERDYELVVHLDADLSHDPRYLPALLAASESADVVIGSRYVAGGGIENWPLARRIMSRCVNWYARPLLGLPVRDCSSGFRCLRVQTLKRLDLSAIQSRGYAFFEEFLWRMKQVEARFAEVPIRFVDRQHGRSKIDSREALVALGMIFRLGVTNWLGL